MIATITLNPALDKMMTIANFTIGKTNRARFDHMEPGGKGINVARVLKQLDCPVVASGFLAGNNGRYISQDLKAREICTEFVQVPGETRVNLKIIDPVSGTLTEINEPGFAVGEEHLRLLHQKVEELAKRCTVMVFSGSLPPGVPQDIYATLLRIARKNGVKTVLDTSGEALRNGLTERPDLIKPNLAEVEDFFQTKVDEEKALVDAARELLLRGARMVVISMGAAGALAAGGDGVIRASAPPIDTCSTVGAGDSMVAALACGLTDGRPLGEKMRLATAASMAALAECENKGEYPMLIEKFVPLVKVREIK